MPVAVVCSSGSPCSASDRHGDSDWPGPRQPEPAAVPVSLTPSPSRSLTGRLYWFKFVFQANSPYLWYKRYRYCGTCGTYGPVYDWFSDISFGMCWCLMSWVQQVHNAAVVARSLGCQCDTEIPTASADCTKGSFQRY